MSRTSIHRFGRAIPALALAGALAATSSVARAQYTDETKATGCDCNTATVGLFTGTDYAQDATTQDAMWVTFRDDNTGLVDADRVGNATWTYNCWSYAINGSDRWLDWGADGVDKFIGTNSGCWETDTGGSVKMNSVHGMLTADSQSKCGRMFVCKNNQHVYGADTPTTRYRQIP